MADKDKKATTGRSPGKSPKKQKPAESESDRRQKHPDQQRVEQEEKQTQQNLSKQERVGGDAPPAGTRADGSEPDDAGATDEVAEEKAFPIVGIGASAGGLEALEAFFSALPNDSRMAFVVITHTASEHASMLPDLLRRKTKVPIREIADGMEAEPDTIFIPPTDRDPVLGKTTFRLKNRPAKPELHMPVDRFLRHLAADRAERAGCVILSGTGTDGTQGLRSVKEHSGVAMAQSPKSAKHTGMPQSAIDTGLVDYVLEPAEMPAQLIEYFWHPAVIAAGPRKGDKQTPEGLRKIINFLAKRTRHDFSLYKESTLVRRLQRRATVTRSKDAEEYFNVLSRNPEEVWALFQDLLIGVTNFFRDPEAFDYLKREVLPDLLTRTPEDAEVRVWTPGCATGEEAYSVAIVFNECMEETNLARKLQVFGTDIDPKAVENARRGVYPKNIASDIGTERLKRFFNRENGNYRIKGEIREQVLFAEQNLLRDPPFSRLDLLVCRNLLIYLKPQAQKKLIPLFHYALKNNGVLFLGNSETVSHFPELFRPLDKQFSIYGKKESVVRPEVQFPVGKVKIADPDRHGPAGEVAADEHVDIGQAIGNLLMREHTPACVAVNAEGEVMYIHGRTGKYLEPAPGNINMRIVDMAREGLRYPLLSGLRQAADQTTPVCKRGVRVKINGEHVFVDLTVKPLSEPQLKDCKLVVFEETPPPAAEKKASDPPPDQDAEQRIVELEQELVRLRHDYRGAMEELESSNEELRSVNEELQSSNEELQSTNEELESSREELQSLNEELNTVNSELHNNIEELDEAYRSITSVLNSTGIAIVFLDTELRVRRFTDEAGRLINLIKDDVGRPLAHISHNLNCDDLSEKAHGVLKKLSVFQEEVQNQDGDWFEMSMRLHRSDSHSIDGVVITFIEITDRKQAEGG